MSIGFGLLGSGFMAQTYAQCLAQHVPNAHLVAVALGSGAPSLGDDYGVPVEAGAEALAAREDVDAVIIATPHSTHLPLARVVAAGGKHVFLEKPLAVDVAECDAIIEACAAAGVLLTVNTVTRYRDAPLAARELVSAGSIGRLRMVRITSSVVDYAPQARWAVLPGEGGGWLDMGVHLFDTLRWYTGAEVETIFAAVRDFGGEPHRRRSAMAELVLDDGVMVQVLVSLEMPAPGIGSQSQWTFVGNEGIVECDSYGKVRLGRDGSWEEIYEMPPFALASDYRDPVRLKAFAAQTEEFAATIEAGGAPVVSGADARAAVALVEAAQQSSDSGEAVHLRPAART